MQATHRPQPDHLKGRGCGRLAPVISRAAEPCKASRATGPMRRGRSWSARDRGSPWSLREGAGPSAHPRTLQAPIPTLGPCAVARVGCFSLGFVYKISIRNPEETPAFAYRRQRITTSPLDSTVLSALALISVFTDPAARILKNEVDDLDLDPKAYVA
jgi:hypothetical protein